MNVVVIVLSNYISSRNREMLTTTNERDTVIIIKQNKESSSKSSLSLARLLFVLSLALKVSSSLLTRSSVCRKDTPKALQKCEKKDRRVPLFFSAS